ncbi:hypothetical protein [uncultured Psychrobacter sp.]|uniref:hypothetical protein n=1 Tax=uncultured Psychrobacter sp. TaxID=259303 RepID=UPI00262533A2|nr:hypothetical protein [uncultured Psychrobacter sp.]
MKMNKLYTGIVLAGALMVSGCGSDDDGEYVGVGSGNGGPIVNNELKFATFDPFNDVVDGEYKTGWVKFAYTLSNKGFTQIISPLVGSSPTAYQDSRSDEEDNSDYYVGNKVFVKVSDEFDSRFYKLKFTDNDSFELRIQTDNRPIDSVYDIKTLDLNGVKKLGGNAKAGIQTDLDYDYFPSNIAFPKGSECYIFQETPSQSYYTFYVLGPREDITIAQWIINEKKNNTVNDLIEEKVGKNNELSAARYTDEDGDIVAAVEYNGLVYDSYYYQKGVTENTDTDFTDDVVNCDQYNTVAANFLEEQIKINYKK